MKNQRENEFIITVTNSTGSNLIETILITKAVKLLQTFATLLLQQYKKRII